LSYGRDSPAFFLPRWKSGMKETRDGAWEVFGGMVVGGFVAVIPGTLVAGGGGGGGGRL